MLDYHVLAGKREGLHNLYLKSKHFENERVSNLKTITDSIKEKVAILILPPTVRLFS